MQNPDPELISEEDWLQYQQLQGNISVSLIKSKASNDLLEMSVLVRSTMPSQRKFAFRQLQSYSLSDLIRSEAIVGIIMLLETKQSQLALDLLQQRLCHELQVIMFQYNVPLQIVHLLKLNPDNTVATKLLWSCLQFPDCPPEIMERVMVQLYETPYLFDKLDWNFVQDCLPYSYRFMASWVDYYQNKMKSYKTWRVLSYLALKDMFVFEDPLQIIQQFDVGLVKQSELSQEQATMVKYFLSYVYAASYYFKAKDSFTVQQVVQVAIQRKDCQMVQRFLKQMGVQ